ncbi:MAG: hypothetical protein ACOYNL_08605 [Rickettsiales bacterium]
MEQTTTPVSTDMSEEALRKMISHLRPDRELYSGRKFFEKLLEFGGPEAVLRFVDKAQVALDKKGGGLDLYYDFDSLERDAFNKSRIDYTKATK